jgi:hypothetical protein
MNQNRHIWEEWSQNLQRWGLRQPAAALLEAAGPLTILGAQAVYLIQPLVGRPASEEALAALAGLLEEPDQTRAFAQYLREAG